MLDRQRHSNTEPVLISLYHPLIKLPAVFTMFTFTVTHTDDDLVTVHLGHFYFYALSHYQKGN